MVALDDPQVWPNLSETATLLHVNKGTLSRQATCGRIVARTLGLGRGQARVVPPGEVLRLAVVYRRVPTLDVAAALARLIAARSGQQVGAFWPAMTVLLAEVDRDLGATEAPLGVVAVPAEPRGGRPGWWGALREPLAADEADAEPLVLIDRAAPLGALALGPLIDDRPRVVLDESGA